MADGMDDFLPPSAADESAPVREAPTLDEDRVEVVANPT
jgi:hypothetical protein